MMISRRGLLGGMAMTSASVMTMHWLVGGDEAAARTYAFVLSDEQWGKRLTAAQYAVLRREATERPFSSSLLKEHRKGIFACAGCALPLFSSATKYDSGTGWPSFWRPLSEAVNTKSDRRLGYRRTEVHCARCGGHLGHLFDDGPRPTGLRYCINGVALKFVPDV